MVSALSVQLVYFLNFLQSSCRCAVGTGFQVAVGLLIQLGVGELREGDPLAVGAVILAVVVGSAVRIVIQLRIRIRYWQLSSLPVFPNHHFDLAAEVLGIDQVINPGHVDSIRSLQALYPDTAVAALGTQFRLGRLVIVAPIPVFLMRHFMHFISTIEADCVGADQPVTGQLTGHVDQQELTGSGLVVRLILRSVPLHQAGGAQERGDHLAFLEYIQPLCQLIHHQGQPARRLYLLQVLCRNVSAHKNIPCLGLCSRFGKERAGIALHQGPSVIQVLNHTHALG